MPINLFAVKKRFKYAVILFFSILLLAIMLAFPQTALPLVRESILIWYQSLLPTLFPAMILSNIILYIFLSGKSDSRRIPVLSALYGTDACGGLVIMLGFLCGFPIGAYLCSKLIKENVLNRREGQYLLGFCNHLSPVYIISVYCQLFSALPPYFVLLLFYGCPLLYGLLRKHFAILKGFEKKTAPVRSVQSKPPDPGRSLTEMIDYGITDAISSIVRLAGYIIFFRLFLLPLKLFHLPSEVSLFFGKLIEITSGVLNYGQNIEISDSFTILLQTLPFMTFGGICCIGQTLCMIKDSGLSIVIYLCDKLLQSGMIILFLYLFRSLLS